MTTYTSAAGTTLEVIEDGQGFITRRHYPATKHSKASVVEKKHRCYSAVEKIINRFGFIKVKTFDLLDPTTHEIAYK